MTKQNKVPTLDVSQLDDFHSKTISLHWGNAVSKSKVKEYHINKLELISDKSNFQVLPHRKTCHDFIYLKKGASKRSKGLNEYTFEGPSIFFLPAYQITEHKIMSDDAEGFFCHFNENIFDFLPNNYLSEQFPFFQYQTSPVINLSLETQKSIETILNRLLFLYSNEESINKKLVSCYLLSLFEEAKKDIPEESPKKKNSFFKITEQYKHLLTEYIYTYRKISDYANMLNVTPNYLNKCVKISINKTAQDLLKEMLILEAKTLIKYSDLHISEIAVKLLDQTPSNFARFFKKQTGLTPKEFIKKN